MSLWGLKDPRYLIRVQHAFVFLYDRLTYASLPSYDLDTWCDVLYCFAGLGMKKKNVLMKVKLIVSTAQIIYSLNGILDVKWPPVGYMHCV